MAALCLHSATLAQDDARLPLTLGLRLSRLRILQLLGNDNVPDFITLKTLDTAWCSRCVSRRSQTGEKAGVRM
jgi:hypothetical protein